MKRPVLLSEPVFFLFLESGIPTLWSVSRPARVILGKETPMPTEHDDDF